MHEEDEETRHKAGAGGQVWTPTFFGPDGVEVSGGEAAGEGAVEPLVPPLLIFDGLLVQRDGLLQRLVCKHQNQVNNKPDRNRSRRGKRGQNPARSVQEKHRLKAELDVEKEACPSERTG